VGGEPVLVPLTPHSLRGLPCQGGFVGLRRVSSGGRRASVQTGAVALKVGEHLREQPLEPLALPRGERASRPAWAGRASRPSATRGPLSTA